MNTRLPAAVAAGHPVTAHAGIEMLRRGGTAADAAVAMMLTSCAAETIFTGLHGGGFATYFDADSGEVTCVDFFVAVPGLGDRVAGELTPLVITLGGQHLEYTIGGASAAVPGNPAGAAYLHRRFGRLDWADVVAPAIKAAEDGVPITDAHHEVLVQVAPAMTYGDGAAMYQHADGRLRGPGDTLGHPGLADALIRIAKYGAEDFYRGDIAARMLDVTAQDGALSEADLSAYKVNESAPRTVRFGRCDVSARGDDLDDVLGTLEMLATEVGITHPSADPAVARTLVRALRAEPRRAETTNLVAADAEGNACALTTSLGLGAGIWIPGYGVHLNSMLGESELLRGELQPGERMGSMMSPMCVTDDNGVRAILGAAGGSRIRPALIQTLIGILYADMSAQAAIDAPRLNALPGAVRLEPGFTREVIDALADLGQVAIDDRLNAYFGGASAITRSGPAGDPRRGGVAVTLS